MLGIFTAAPILSARSFPARIRVATAFLIAIVAAPLAGYADKGYQGAGGAIGTPYKRKKGRKLGKRKKLFNRYHAKVRAVGERGAATLKQWHILRKARCSPSRMTAVVQAILTLEYQGR